MRPKADEQPAKSAARNQTKRVMKKLKTKPEMLRRNGPVIKSVESVLRPEGSGVYMVGKICERGKLRS